MGLRGHTPTVAPGRQTVRFLVALIGHSHIAFPAHWVRGIITLAEAGLHERVSWANSTYERTDLAGRLAIESQTPTADSRIILYGNDQRWRSFMVDGVVGLVDVNRSQVHALPPHFRGGERDRILGILIKPAYVALIANPFWVLELPTCANVLDGFALAQSEGRATESENGFRLPSTVLEDPAPLPAAQVK